MSRQMQLLTRLRTVIHGTAQPKVCLSFGIIEYIENDTYDYAKAISCEGILSNANISLSAFYAWNVSVNPGLLLEIMETLTLQFALYSQA